MIVLNVAVVVFIISLVVVGIILYFSVRNSNFPPYDSQCPTYYKADADNNCVFDNTTYNPSPGNFFPSMAVESTSGSDCTKVPINSFYGDGFSDDEVLCAKNRWAKRCKVYWDGVSNNSRACYNVSNSLFPGSTKTY